MRDEAPLTAVAMVRGSAWITPRLGVPTRLRAGDVAVVRGPEPYEVADDPETPTQILILPGQRCTSVDGVDLHEAMELGVRTWGNNPDGSAVLLTGTYQLDGAVSGRLLGALPPLVVVEADDLESPLVPLLAEEIARDEPGQSAVLDRLLDLLLIAVLRSWFARPDAGAPAWYRAQADPVVGAVLRLLHHRAAEPWTVATLARQVGVSRALLARRFTELVGEPPMTYLTTWRLALAADLLREPDASVGSVARAVGYATPYSFSTAFKRHRGVSPTAHRRNHQGADHVGAG